MVRRKSSSNAYFSIRLYKIRPLSYFLSMLFCSLQLIYWKNWNFCIQFILSEFLIFIIELIIGDQETKWFLRARTVLSTSVLAQRDKLVTKLNYKYSDWIWLFEFKIYVKISVNQLTKLEINNVPQNKMNEIWINM